ncbi:hypothetical protein DFH05DRAFT_588787 [Lentinula detonsa]|uniref:Uncharacterized protein n=1 Tax=Lentinula detonsa TaxID=2804962 RepID=A0A9W8U175_9AGAR|nr:hypothetical protein DFH05DRAFT_588787 [Lentinula detonsa]
MTSSIRRAFKQKTNTGVSEGSPATTTTVTRSFFRTSLRGRSSSKTSKTAATEPESPSRSRTKRTIKTSDITYIFPDDTAILEDLSPQLELADRDEDDYLSRPDSPPLIIDKALVDQFPLPPVVHAYTSPDIRIPIPSSGFEPSSLLSSDEILPSPHPRVQRFMAEQKALNDLLRRQPIARSSSVTSYSRPTATAYSALFQDNGSSTSSLPPPSSGSRTHRRTDHSQSLSNRSRPLLHQRSYSDMDFERHGRRTRLRAQTPVKVIYDPGRMKV